ncbi:hypothetical protein ALC56_03068 [Trachymyrmex septentrionalis]|uniref:Uncharacterized protein n=1 Tax=Trachymyrmex septentrionalis TaxID=34720 RepID=A0A195FQF7_9HYME|nr:hypothetical protein ALC56_03068 [Trachymyrmex septentrionalis]
MACTYDRASICGTIHAHRITHTLRRSIYVCVYANCTYFYQENKTLLSVKQASESGVPTSEQLINEANARMLTGPSISTPGTSRVHSYACIVQYIRENHTQICVHTRNCTLALRTHDSASIWSIIEYLAACAENSADWSVVAGWLTTRLVAFGSPSSSRLAQSYSNRASDRVVFYPLSQFRDSVVCVCAYVNLPCETYHVNLLRSGNVEQSVRYGQGWRGELKAWLTQFVRGVVVNEGDLEDSGENT